MRDKLRQSVEIPLSLGSETTQPEHSTGETAFKSYVRQIREYILNGDCMQVVPAQGMKLPFKDNPLHLYRALRTLNPSPYLFYYDFGDFHIVGSSPEILVRRERDKVVVRPIAGTRLRGATPEQDAENARDLLNDPKEIAEHTMLIDLGRNDVGRISEIGSVVVTDKMVIEKYSHVMHIVSNVEGSLKQGVSNMDILAATFPAGTLSGAPKVRALEIIEELETEKRNIFGGAVGVWGFNQDMDLAIAIRTAIIQDDVLYVKSGAGIVADSVEESEWQETQNKARAVLRRANGAGRFGQLMFCDICEWHCRPLGLSGSLKLNSPHVQAKSARLVRPQFRVQTAFCQQFRVAAFFHDFAFVQHNQSVHRRDGGQSVGNRNHRFAVHHLVQTLLNGGFHFAVQCAGGFVQQQNGRVFQHHTRNGNALALSARQFYAAFANVCVIACSAFCVRQLRNEICRFRFWAA